MKMFTTQQKQAAFSRKSCKSIIQEIATFILQSNYLSLESEESISTFLLQSKSWLKRKCNCSKKPTCKILCHQQKRNIKLSIFIIVN